jgi:hypothetical protein
VQFDIKTTFPFMGSMSSIKTFDIHGSPINGYIITKTQDMYLPNHLIVINGRELPVNASNNYESRRSVVRLSLDKIPEGFLINGTNTIQFKLSSIDLPSLDEIGDPRFSRPVMPWEEMGRKDDFLILDVVIHWRENVQ